MADWSDGRVRSENFKGSELAREISRYFEEHREEEILMFRWENEALRKELAERQLKVRKATA